ncbi:sensor histidine kinase [Sphaerisporangium perillae]|uniref:sensor histidine kinase n=1 Tax=Sphaerisporangium perillae TaxID=2935860 RepID=UPI0020101261|nr:histidine kinase [Sphaerisporangium perillae]
MAGLRGRTATIAAPSRILLVIAFVAAQAGQNPGFPLTGRGMLDAGLTLTVAGLLGAAPRRGAPNASSPKTVLGIPVRLGTVTLASLTLLVASPDSKPPIAALLFAVGAAAIRYPLLRALPVGLLTLAGLIVVGMAGGHWDQELSLAVSACVVFLFAYSIRQGRAAKDAEDREAVLAERARIAREIHDILAHSLSAQIVHLEGARLLLRADRPQEALDRVERARDLAKSGLEEARRAVSALREDIPPLPEALKVLAEEFRATTGEECTLTVTGAERRLAPEAELAVIRTAQEALTNVRRHAPGAAAAVRLCAEDRGCELEVTNPAGDTPGTPGGGYGLVGMRERAELLGGELEAGAVDGGFRVRLRLPVTGARA